MAQNFDQIVDGYPQSIGAKIQYIVDHAGPLSYTTGGEAYIPSNLGIGGFDKISGGNSFSAVAPNGTTYSVAATYPAGSQSNGVSTVQLVWSTAGSEVSAGTNLNGVYVRLEIIGY
jgi:hypothetical protein